MSSLHDRVPKIPKPLPGGGHGWRSLRPRRPASAWEWLLWLLVALLFYLLISYVLVPWWYRPVPTDLPPAPPTTSAGRA